jgi:hypothetical protein
MPTNDDPRPSAKPDAVERHPQWGPLAIEIEFYELANGNNRIWASIVRSQDQSETKDPFIAGREFPSGKAAREAALKEGRDNIEADFAAS